LFLFLCADKGKRKAPAARAEKLQLSKSFFYIPFLPEPERKGKSLSEYIVGRIEP
jgi:hypothetical protein